MKKILRRSISLLALCTIGYSSQAQQYVATMLNFTNPSPTEGEYGFSTVEFNGYSIYGTQFNKTINVYKDNAFIFQAQSPNFDASSRRSFGHALGMNQDWVASSAFMDDLSASDVNTFNHGRVYLSKNINGVPQNNFTTVIEAQTPQHQDNYGESLDLYGEWMVVGAPSKSPTQTGYIEIWKQTATGWERKQKISPTGVSNGAQFGISVAMHGDYIVVGAHIAKKVFVYKLTNNVWSLHSSYAPDLTTWAGPRNNTSPNVYSSNFGFDVDVFENKIIVGDPFSGVQKAAILTINASTTTLTHTLLPPGHSETAFTTYGEYGTSVAIGDDKALVGAPRQFHNPALTDKIFEGKVFFYSNNFQYNGYINVGTPAGKNVLGLGKSVAINGEYVLVGAENTDNLITPDINEGVAFRMPFYYINQTGNTPPFITISSPNINSTFNAPASITIEAFANDADGTINAVEFYQDGGIYLGSDNTAPYTFTLTNVSAGNKYFYVRTYDNQGVMALADVFVTVNSPVADINGPACGSKNQTLQFELDASKRVNATGFNWYYTGSNQGLTPVSGASYKANLATGNNFSAGQICVGVNYSSAPWYTSYCINVATCSALREGSTDEPLLAKKSISFPNPFNTTSTIEFANEKSTAKIKVMDAAGLVVLKTEATGSFTFGDGLEAGMYLVTMEFPDKTEYIKVVKE